MCAGSEIAPCSRGAGGAGGSAAGAGSAGGSEAGASRAGAGSAGAGSAGASGAAGAGSGAGTGAERPVLGPKVSTNYSVPNFLVRKSCGVEEFAQRETGRALCR
jgi:hypothetical protein